MATPMLQARAALRIIDKMDKLAKQRVGNSPQQSEAAPLGGNETIAAENRSLERPPSHTTVDIPELATLDSAKVSAAVPAHMILCKEADAEWHCMGSGVT